MGKIGYKGAKTQILFTAKVLLATKTQ